MRQHIKISILVIIFISGLLISCGGSSDKAPASVASPPKTEAPITLPTVVQNHLPDELSPQEAISQMAIGINLGNTLDAPFEGDWAPKAQEFHIQAFKDAGFKHVRIPITWGNHISKTTPYEINEDFMLRVEQIVMWALDRDLIVIINAHHDDWIKSDFNNQQTRNRFDSIWLQVSERFKHHSAKLIFEILNEPQDLSLTNTNTLNQRALKIIRNQTSNRLVIFAGTEWSNIEQLTLVDTPDPSDRFLTGNFHSYDPWSFAGQCLTSWGTDEDIENLENIYQRALDWSTEKDIPVMVNEFGVAKYDFTQPENKCEQTEREAYIRAHVINAKKYGVAATFWDDAGSFSTYDRIENSWGPEKDILVSQ